MRSTLLAFWLCGRVVIQEEFTRARAGGGGGGEDGLLIIVSVAFAGIFVGEHMLDKACNRGVGLGLGLRSAYPFPPCSISS